MERTLVLIKPDAIQRDLVGEIISRFERKGLKLVGIKMMCLSDNLLGEHYQHLQGRNYFMEAFTFMKNRPIIACCWEGIDAVKAARLLCGITRACEAKTGTVRGDLAMSSQANLIHTSNSPEEALVEIARFFSSEELFSYDCINLSFYFSINDI